MDANSKTLNEVLKFLLFQSQIDCSAIRINTELSEYFWRRQDPKAKFINAFTVNWCLYLCYLFLPFSLLPCVLQKIQVEQIEALISPLSWPKNLGSVKFMSLAAQERLIYKPNAAILILSKDHKAKHLIERKLFLVVALLSMKNIEN